MRPDVYIVLNERESVKARSAKQLEERLQLQEILVKRILPKENIKEIVLKGQPRIVVTDYLLGDFSTGLDLLEAISHPDAKCDSRTIFYTDEPSVQVAVSALRMGAAHYFELEDPAALDQLTLEIKKLLTQQKAPPAVKPLIPRLKLTDLAMEAKSSKLMVQKAQLNTVRKPAITVILGAPGTGRSTLANAILEQNKKPNLWIKQIDLASCLLTAEQILKPSSKQLSELSLGRNLALILQHAETDPCELLKGVENNYRHLWPNGPEHPVEGRIILTTSSEETAKAWETLLQADIIEVPTLEHRKEDFIPLLQAFHQHAQSIAETKIQPCPAKLVLQLSRQKWPGEIKQLKAVTIDALISTTFEKTSLEELIKNALERWQQNQEANDTITISPLGASLLLEDNNNDYRITAAKLGITIKDLRKLVAT